MKNILLIAFFLLFGSISSYSQFNTLLPFKPNDGDGLKKVRAQAVTDGIVAPKLILVGTMNGTIPLQGVEVALTVDLKKGTSTGWVYVFTDAKGDSTKTYACVKLPFLGFMAIAVPFNLIGDQIPFTPTKSLDDYSWKSFDLFVDSLSKDDNYKQYIKDMPDYTIGMMGLGVNTENPLVDLNKPYWLITFTAKGGNLTCFMHAETGTSTCLGFWDVKDEVLKANLPKVSPLPAIERLTLNFPDGLILKSAIVNISDMQGNTMQVINMDDIQSGSKFSIDLNNYASGSYNLIFISNLGVSRIPFIINK